MDITCSSKDVVHTTYFSIQLKQGQKEKKMQHFTFRRTDARLAYAIPAPFQGIQTSPKRHILMIAMLHINWYG
jgi:hypothetical protein